MLEAMNLHPCRRAFFCVLLLGALSSARGQIVLANYSTNNPVKIMCLGDSITDDCQYQGAWRAYLQPLLDNSGYPFTFVGRNHTPTPPPGFTKTAHEGYCGSVIAPPGVLSYSVYGYAGSNVDLQEIVPDAIAANTPDLILIMIGANDIGRGRAPGQVASNDLPHLLDTIFSLAPNVNIICTKMTSLDNAMVSGLNYGQYSFNVYKYNAYLQAVINQRRALGQKVSLADMFSVVDPSTMFNSDHLHPNPTGLQAVAQEFFTRIQAITITTNQFTTTLIHGGDPWNYNDTGVDLGTNWSQTNYDDSAWSNGPARLGYGDNTTVTTVSYGGNTTNRNMTTYFRHAVVVPTHAVITNLLFKLDRVDGGVAYLDGLEAFRSNMPGGPISYTNAAAATLAGFDAAYTFYPTNIPLANPISGTNVIAVEIHKLTPVKSSMGFDMELIGMGYYIPSPAISINGGNVLLTWPVNNSASFSLFAASGVSSGIWTNTSAPMQTNGGQVTATLPLSAATQFFRLQP
jgi:lysophospholipase L1-like esterase